MWQAPAKGACYARHPFWGFCQSCAGCVRRVGFRPDCPVAWTTTEIGQEHEKPLRSIWLPRGVGKNSTV